MLPLPTSKPTFSTRAQHRAISLGFVQPWPDRLKLTSTRIRIFLLHLTSWRPTWPWKQADQTDQLQKYGFVPETLQANAVKASLADNYFHSYSVQAWLENQMDIKRTEIALHAPGPQRVAHRLETSSRDNLATWIVGAPKQHQQCRCEFAAQDHGAQPGLRNVARQVVSWDEH